MELIERRHSASHDKFEEVDVGTYGKAISLSFPYN